MACIDFIEELQPNDSSMSSAIQQFEKLYVCRFTEITNVFANLEMHEIAFEPFLNVFAYLASDISSE